MKHSLSVSAVIATILLAFDHLLPLPASVPTWCLLLILAASLWSLWFSRRRYDEMVRHRDALELHLVRTHADRLMPGDRAGRGAGGGDSGGGNSESGDAVQR